MSYSLLIPVVTVLALGGGQAMSQPTGLQNASSNDFVILKQPQSDHEVRLRVRPEDTSLAPTQWQWERVEPAGISYREALSIKWSATASCASGIRQLRIEGPGPTEVQNLNGSRNAISGHTVFQSVTDAAADRVCEAWARQVTLACGENPQTEPGCEQERTFSFDEDNPVPQNPAIRVSGSCMNNASLPVRTYSARINIICDLRGF